jgi:D-proline reductase (dithiol) PrdB
VSLIARHLESHGLPTLCIVSALDIIECGRPPRAVFVDYPLGHTTGRAFDAENQTGILAAALRAFESIDSPGQILSLPYQWSADQAWRADAVDVNRGDTRQTRDTTPRYQSDADRILAESRTQA